MRVRIREALRRSHSFLGSYFRLFEVAGLFLILTAGALELISIRATDRHRAYYEQNVQAQIIVDEVTYRAFLQKESMLLQQSPSSNPLREVITGEKDVVARLIELANQSLDTYQMIWTRAEGLNQRITEFRKRVGLPESAQLVGARDGFVAMKSATEGLRKELKEDQGAFRFPIGHLMEAELLAAQARDETIAAALDTINEVESRRSSRSRVYVLLFVLGSVAVILGKYGNWVHERGRSVARSGA